MILNPDEAEVSSMARLLRIEKTQGAGLALNVDYSPSGASPGASDPRLAHQLTAFIAAVESLAVSGEGRDRRISVELRPPRRWRYVRRVHFSRGAPALRRDSLRCPDHLRQC